MGDRDVCDVTGHSLEVRDLRFSYPGGVPVLDGLSLAFPPGLKTGVIGANGAGKSTLLLVVMGVLKPAGGGVFLDGVALSSGTLAEFRRKIGLTFQNPDDQLFMATVGDDVAFGPRQMGLGEERVEERVAGALARVGLSALRDRPPLGLSGGEKRAAALAGVLAMQPDVLVLDEPTASLDPRARRRVIRLLAGLDQTTIVTSHDLDMILETCDHVAVLRDGALAAEGRPGDILSDAILLQACGLELPLSLQGCPRCGCDEPETERRQS